MYDELIAELRMHHCDAKEDDTQEVCEECAYDVIIADKSVPSGIASVCVCGLMHKAADAIEELSKPKWIPVTERLPEIGENVLLYAYGRVHFGKLLFLENNLGHPTFLMEQSGLQHSPVLDTTAHNEFTKNRITHWMPLPEPPEKESES